MPCYVVPAPTASLSPDPLDPEQIVSGDPEVSTHEILQTEHVDIGIWEHTAGVSTDVEVDEVFVVLSGRASIEVAGGADPRGRPGRRRGAGSRCADPLDRPRGPPQDLHHPLTPTRPPHWRR